MTRLIVCPTSIRVKSDSTGSGGRGAGGCGVGGGIGDEVGAAVVGIVGSRNVRRVSSHATVMNEVRQSTAHRIVFMVHF